MAADAGGETRRRAAARRVGTWRRLVLLRGPVAAIPTAMMVAEPVHEQGDELVSRPTHQTVADVIRSSPRTVGRHIAQLVNEGWLERIGPRAVRGTAQAYALRLPADRALIDEASSLKRGMWERLLGRQPDSGDGLSAIGQPDTDDVLTPIAGHRGRNSRSSVTPQPVTNDHPTGYRQDMTGPAATRARTARPEPRDVGETYAEAARRLGIHRRDGESIDLFRRRVADAVASERYPDIARSVRTGSPSIAASRSDRGGGVCRACAGEGCRWCGGAGPSAGRM